MPRALQIVIFLSIALTLLGGLHYYVWVRLVRDIGFSPHGRRIGTIVLIALYVMGPIALVSGRLLPPTIAKVVVYPGYVWMGTLFLTCVLLAVSDLVRLVVLLGMRAASVPASPERRLFISRIVGGAVATVGAGAAAWSIKSALGKAEIKNLPIVLPGLPAALDGTTIAQLTDIHIGPTLGRAWLERVVRQTNELEPDIIAITGDLVDGTVDDLRDGVAPLAQLKAKYGVFFVTGNHEYYSGAAEWVAHLQTLGIRVLRNERISIGDGAASFDLAGVDDYNAGGMARGHKHDPDAALAGRDPSRALVLLAHQPRSITAAARHGVGLQLSGHTHGGQIWPWRYMVYLQQPYVDGLHRIGDTMLYVSVGCGYWGPPMRFNSPPEIPRIVLRSPEVV